MKVSFGQFSAKSIPMVSTANHNSKNISVSDTATNAPKELISSKGVMAIRASVLSGVSFKGQKREEESFKNGARQVIKYDEDGGVVQKVNFASDNKTVKSIEDMAQKTVVTFREDGSILSVNDQNLGAEIHYKGDGETISYINDFENEKVIYFKQDGMMIDHEVDYKGRVYLP